MALGLVPPATSPTSFTRAYAEMPYIWSFLFSDGVALAPSIVRFIATPHQRATSGRKTPLRTGEDSTQAWRLTFSGRTGEKPARLGVLPALQNRQPTI